MRVRRAERVLAPDGVRQRFRRAKPAVGAAQEQLRRIAVLREGATETAAVASGLLSDLVTRGLPTDRTLLFVIDGAPGLRRAISNVFALGVVQRCQVHKLRNVLGHRPNGCTLEDREVGPAVAVEVVRDHDRSVRVDRPFDQFRCVSEAAVLLADALAARRCGC